MGVKADSDPNDTDLIIVCFGLNDINDDAIERLVNDLK